ncbi:hypothetical protein CHGG_11081 [Chaetomium globosum CBS 148.51]|uniref:Integrase catalytic domain-containing protein n=1 Tax=Chaetomium globosum (strain ATCC 6205 / CBS 148.51 / DSM 1962 / NBRC 6347 / NRRL 1970) TaxID=306901 RepID=Q2GLX5_CHAGB|nr:uncharacterized protein CHGG_11081 [Chaetomium globosum CBS 148.51]EAQ82905.1 hypothetical protein CHGG_11081 [Chaetomium globosum CBS 148.51]
MPDNDNPLAGLPPANNDIIDDGDDDDLDLTKITVPTIIPLKGDHNLEEWKLEVRVAFRLLNITKFLDGTAVEPPANASSKKKNKFRVQQTVAYAALSKSVAPVRDIIKSNGYVYAEDDFDPYKLYLATCKALTGMSDEGWCGMVWELSQINASNYDTLRAFVSRFHYLIAKLKDVGINLPDRFLQAQLLLGLKTYDANWVDMLRFQLQTGQLDYEKLLNLVTTKANEQTMFNMSATSNQTAKKGNNQQAGQQKSRPQSQQQAGAQSGSLCGDPRCGKYHPSTPRHPYHDICKLHHPGGNDECWVVHPEKKKEYHARKKKNDASSNTCNTNSSGTPDGGNNNNANRGIFNFDSGVMNGVNNNRANALINTVHLMTAIDVYNLDIADDGAEPSEAADKVVASAVVGSISADSKITRDTVCLDSGASNSVFNESKWFDDLSELDQPVKVASANGGTSNHALGGVVSLSCERSCGGLTNLTIRNAIYSKDTPLNLVSTGQLRRRGAVFDGLTDRLILKDNPAQEVAQLGWVGDISVFKLNSIPVQSTEVVLVAIQHLALPAIDYEVMHRRLMHASMDKVIKACRQAGIKINTRDAGSHRCKWCYLGKSQQLISHDKLPAVSRALQRIHVDSIPHKPTGIGGKNHAIHIVDQYSAYHWYVAIGSKSDGFTALTNYIVFVEVQSGTLVQEIHVDNGTEFSMDKLRDWCLARGKKLTPISPNCPQQNPMAERAGRTIVEGARTANLEAGFPEEYWPLAEEAFVHVLNRLPTSHNTDDKSPMQTLGESLGLARDQCIPRIHHLRAYGAITFVHIHDKKVRPQGRKMLAKAIEGKLCGYEGNSGKVYRIRLNAVGVFKGKEAAEKLLAGLFVDLDQFELEAPEMIMSVIDNKDLFAPTHAKIPKTYKEASKRTDFYTHWQPACQEQYDKLIASGTWKLVDRPPGANVLPGKWVFDQKFDDQSNWVRNRARWVVCGNFENGDYQPYEVYSAVVHASTVRIFFNLVAALDLECHQFDVVSAFLNAIVPDDVDVYVRQPTGFEDGTDKVCRLVKALYGLQRSSLWWYQTLVPELKKLDFEPLTTDGCMFKHTGNGALLLIYVDDFLLAAPTVESINKVADVLGSIFELKCLGEARTFLGYTVFRDRDNRVIYVNQATYVTKILERFGKTNLHAVKTPWITGGFNLPKTYDVVESATKGYQSEVGAINYLANGTRSDISYTTMRLGEANSGPSSAHLQLLQHLWRYISGTRDLGIRCGGGITPSNLQLRAYGDASFATDLLTRVSVGGHVVMIGNCPVVWKAKKQTLVTLSSTEAEFINLTPTALSLLWVANVLKDAGYQQNAPLLFFTDSANARAIALNPLNTARTYHIDLRYKWIIQRMAMGQFQLDHVGTDDMVADGLTKGLSGAKHAQFVKQLGLCVPPLREGKIRAD